MYKIERFVLGDFAVNSYLLWEDNHVLIVDPGSYSKKIVASIHEQEGIVDGILLTHAHFDHIAGVDAFAKEYECPVYMNLLDKPLLKDPLLNFSKGAGMKEVIVQSPVKNIMPGENTIGKFSFTFLDAPGHSEGSSLILWHDILLSGDVLFKGSIGRTDLPTSNNGQMKQTLDKLKTLDPRLQVYPGHGDATILQEELLLNPYLNW